MCVFKMYADIDECLEFMPLCHQCNNTIGSYQCTCNEGYKEINNGTFMYCEGEP